MTNDQLNELLARKMGYDEVYDMLENAAFDSIVDGICTKCLEPQDCEPDARRNRCESCGSPTVRSCLDIAGII